MGIMAPERVDEHLETILRLAFLAEYRDDDMSGHLRRVSRLAQLVGEALHLPDHVVACLGQAAPMHDVGKVGIPDEILLKPSALTADERLIMQNHTLLGSRLLEGGATEMLDCAERIALAHHERWDGTGYPSQLAGEAIPLEARIVALADAYDGMVTRRVYKGAMSHEEARDIVERERGRHFDPAVVDAFLGRHDEVLALYSELGDDTGMWVV